MGKIRLSAAKIAELRQSQRALHDILTEFDALEECGGDCAAWREQHAEAQRRIDALLKHYAPEQVSR